MRHFESLNDTAKLGLVAAVYFLVAKLGLSLATVHENVTLVWPPTGFSLSVLLLLGYHYWPGIALGAFLANATTNVSFTTAAGIAIGNTLEAVLGAYMLQRLVGFRTALDRLRDALGLILLAAVVSTTVSATIGVASLCLGGFAEWSNYGSIWWVWWLGDAMGDLILAPALLSWGTRPLPELRPQRPAEMLALLASLVISTQVVFGAWLPGSVSHYSLAHTIFPVLIWAALRFGQRGASLATLFVSSQAIWDTANSLGPFAGQSLNESLMLLQVFMGVAVATTLILAAVISERNQAEDQRRRLEAQIQHVQKLESLGVLAGGIAHDFNNLLLVVLAHAVLAREKLAPDSALGENLERIEKAAQRAAELTHQMLAYSGKAVFIVEPINLSRLVGDMAELLEVSISKKAIITYDLNPNLPPVQSDATQVRQVVMNLITNASDAIADQRGFITVTTGVVQANRSYLSDSYLDEEMPEGAYAFLEVTDTGCGMDKRTLARIFDPFYTTKFTGRGLGLAAVLGIVRSHRGVLKVSSQPGGGSTFRVLFPVSHEPVPPAAETPALRAAMRDGQTILVVDDEEDVRTVAQIILENFGYRVLTARDGRTAVEVFRDRSQEITAILLDMTMPDMDGEEAFAAMRSIRSDIRVILSSGFSESEAAKGFAGKGLAGFIQKPYKPQSLLEKLHEVLDRKADPL